MTYSELRGEAIAAFEHELKIKLGSPSHYQDMMRAILRTIGILVEEQHIDHVMLFDGQSTSALTGAILWGSNLSGSLVREPSDRDQDEEWVIVGEPPKEGDRVLVVEDTYDALQRNKGRLRTIHTYTKADVCAAVVFSARSHATRTLRIGSDDLRVESIGRYHRLPPSTSRGDRETENPSVSRDNQREERDVAKTENEQNSGDAAYPGVSPGYYTADTLPPVSEVARARYERNRDILAKRAAAEDPAKAPLTPTGKLRIKDRIRPGVRLTDKAMRSVLGADGGRSHSRLRKQG